MSKKSILEAIVQVDRSLGTKSLDKNRIFSLRGLSVAFNLFLFLIFGLTWWASYRTISGARENKPESGPSPDQLYIISCCCFSPSTPKFEGTPRDLTTTSKSNPSKFHKVDLSNYNFITDSDAKETKYG